MKKSKNSKEVFERYLSDRHSAEDFKKIQSYFTGNDEGELFDLVESKLAEDYRDGDEDKVTHIIAKTDDAIHQLISRESAKSTSVSKPVFRNIKVISLVAAAILFCIVSVSLYFVFTKDDPQVESKSIAAQASPGGNRATLILGDGTVLALDTMELGRVTEANGLLLSKDEEGMITYTTTADRSDTKMSFNMLKTPLGGQYKVILADGTRVWLNAASSIRYPSRFDAHERRVELTGEAYFEVMKDKSKPFIVVSNGQKVKVLGTEFNVNTSDYQGSARTTLIEGSVEVSNNNNNLLLTPGQQAVVKNEKIMLRNNIDTQQVTAWKRGEFDFDGAKIEDIMYQIQKWYNIEVAYRGTIEHSFVLKIKRDVNLSEILNILEMTDLVHFRFEKNKIIVTP